MHPRFVLLTQGRLERNRAMAMLNGLEPPAAGAPIDQLLADAFNANNAILAYAVGVARTDLPALPHSEPWYEAFVKGVSNLKTRALVWQNSIAPRVIEIPAAIVDFGAIFVLRINQIDGDIERLLADPGNQAARDNLRRSLGDLSQATGRQQKTLQALRQDIGHYADSLTGDAGILKKAAADGLAAIGGARDQIQAIERDLVLLRDELGKYNTILEVAKIGGIDSVVIVVIGVGLIYLFNPFLSVGIGLFLIPIGIAGGIAALVAALVAAVNIQEINGRITQRNAELTAEGQQVAALTAINQIVDRLVMLAEGASQGIGAIERAWTALQEDVDAVVDDLARAERDLARDQLLVLQSDIQDATADWKILVELARKFAGLRFVISPTTTPIPPPATTIRAA
jgi:methyl-accepting chemotaxis protein